LRSILSISLPIALGYDLRSALIAVENMLIPAGLKQCGSSYAQSLAAYGIVKGIALPTIQFPSAFLAAFSLLLIPEISHSRAAGQSGDIRSMADRVFCICLRFSLPVTCLFACFGPDIGRLLYGNPDAGQMLRLLCPLVPFMYLDSIVDAMLKGMDEQMYSLKVNLSDSCLRIVLMVVLLPRLGIYGYLAALYTSILYNAILSIGRFLRTGQMHVRWFSWILLPGLTAGIVCLYSRFLLHTVASLPLRCLSGVVLSVLLYLLLLGLLSIKNVRAADVHTRTV
jgi:stage V sporulation protein B